MSLHVDHILSINELPQECIDDCSAPGPADEAVTYWRKRLGFTVNQRRAVRCLKGYGAWDAEELAALDEDEIAEKILWLAACDFGEFQVGGDSAGSDIFVLE